MRFIRKSIIGKSIFFFILLVILVVTEWNYLNFIGVSVLPLNTILYLTVGLLAFVFLAFIVNIFIPLAKVAKQITNLFTGKTYQRIQPTTIDEVGIVTHFFNEITQDLEKISYDVKERRRMSSELDIASEIQRNVLPQEAPEIPGLDIVAKTRSAAEVGGDNFDFLESNDGIQLFIYIGDVTGHGVPAGLIMMMVDTLMAALVTQGMNNSHDLISDTNKLLYPRISSRLFMTTVMLRWDKKEQQMFYTGAGHEHVLVYRQATEEVDAITSGGIALGMIPDVSKIIMEKPLNLKIGDCIVLYSDGITEAKNHTGEMYGLEKLVLSLKKNGYKPLAESIFDSLTKDFSNFVREYIQIDDITMMVIKYLGPQAMTKKAKLALTKDAAQAGPHTKNWNWD